jgi:hypothetical protein
MADRGELSLIRDKGFNATRQIEPAFLYCGVQRCQWKERHHRDWKLVICIW